MTKRLRIRTAAHITGINRETVGTLALLVGRGLAVSQNDSPLLK
jgi:hypothetical protein